MGKLIKMAVEPTTVQRSPWRNLLSTLCEDQLCDVIAGTGVKQVGLIVSAERPQQVTRLCHALSAAGNTVVSMFVFPRVTYKELAINGAPLGFT